MKLGSSIYKFFAIIVFFMVIAIFVLIFSRNMVSERALVKAVEFGETVYPDFENKGGSCQGVDTDGDGYVTCSLRITKSSDDKTITLKCPTFVNSYFGYSCKQSQLILGE